MAQEEQERMLKKCPEIVVATPGRFWELVKEGNPFLQQVDRLPVRSDFFAIKKSSKLMYDSVAW
jgi:hypothetical protein